MERLFRDATREEKSVRDSLTAINAEISQMEHVLRTVVARVAFLSDGVNTIVLAHNAWSRKCPRSNAVV